MTMPGTIYLPGTQSALASRTSEAIGRNPDRRTGVVVSFTDGILKVSVGGGEPEQVGYLAGYLPEVGDVVMLILQRSTWVCVDRLANPANVQLAPSFNGMYVQGVGVTSNSTTFVNIPTLSFSFYKRRNASRVFAEVIGASYSDATNAVSQFGVNIDGNDYGLSFFNHNATAYHHSHGGFDFIEDIPAGNYVAQGRFRRAQGGGTVIIDANDRISLLCAEVE